MNRPDEILKEIANVIWEQIWASTEWNVVGSWGTNKLAYTEIQDRFTDRDQLCHRQSHHLPR